MTTDPANLSPYGPVAIFSPDRRYRYLLVRRSGFGERAIMFTMLNPSRASETRSDPTVNRCVDYANRWGYGYMIVTNASPFRSPYPRDLVEAGAEPEDVERTNTDTIRRLAGLVDEVIVAWGDDGALEGRDDRALAAIRAAGAEPKCLGTTKSGYPLHPLRLPKTRLPVPYVKETGK